MLKKEIIGEFKYRRLNSKVNNYIFTGVYDFKILGSIPDKCNITLPENDIDVSFADNIRIDLKEINVKDILSYTLDILKRQSLLDTFFDYKLDFNNKLDLLKFQGVLYHYNRIVQLIFYNLEELSLKEQMLFNEIYYFKSIFFNANSFIKGDHFQSYFLTGDRVLDSRENYKRVKLSLIDR